MKTKEFIRRHFEHLNQLRDGVKYPEMVRVTAVRRFIQADGKHFYEVTGMYRRPWRKTYVI